MQLDALKGPYQAVQLTDELEAVGIRLNQAPPDIYYKVQFEQLVLVAIILRNRSVSEETYIQKLFIIESSIIFAHMFHVNSFCFQR